MEDNTQFLCGLSPLARGTPRIYWRVYDKARFIPAGAGNTSSIGCTKTYLPVYPRWRGEHRSSTSCMSLRIGLSPLARGTRQSRCYSGFNQRFIPAGAGNTARSSKATPAVPVYPRWRGEHINPGDTADTFTGLSPLARGTRGKRPVPVRPRRFIPAGAGNT